MYTISDEQLEMIHHDLHAKGIGIEELRHDLLDHICIIIENELEPDGDFEAFYRLTLRRFYKEELREIEEETRLLLSLRGRLVLGRNVFFLVLFAFLGGPFIGYLVSYGVLGPIPDRAWDASLVFSLFPMLVLLVLYLTPDRLDPVIPWKSKVLIGVKPFIQIVRIA